MIIAETQPTGRLFTSQTDSELRLVDIALLPEWRRRGIGGEVIRNLLSAATAEGKTVRLHVEHNNPARRLYERLQFVTVNNTGTHFLMEWQPQDKLPPNHSSPSPASETSNVR